MRPGIPVARPRTSGAWTPTPALRLAVRVLGGSRNGVVLRLGPGDIAAGVVLGHGPDCGLRFDPRVDAAVAKHHVILVQRGAALLVQDLAGRGDVLVDGHDVPAGGTFLHEGSRIQLGQRGPIVVVESDRATVAASPPPIPELDPAALVPEPPPMFARVAPRAAAPRPGRAMRLALLAVLLLMAATLGALRLEADTDQRAERDHAQASVARLRARRDATLRSARASLLQSRNALLRSRDELAQTLGELWPAEGPPLDDPPSRRIAAARRAVANAARTVAFGLQQQTTLDD